MHSAAMFSEIQRLQERISGEEIETPKHNELGKVVQFAVSDESLMSLDLTRPEWQKKC